MLAHLMINDLLDNEIGLRNFGWNGYQPPLTKLSAQLPDRPGLHPGEPDERGGPARGLRHRAHVLRGEPEHRGALASVLVRVQGRWLSRDAGHDRATRRLWPALALPGTFWLIALFLVPFYAVMAVAFSGNINIFGEPIPAWNPLDWQFATFNQVISDSISGTYQAVWIRTAIYTVWALLICVVVGYPVAYYTARLAGKRRGWSWR